MNDDGKLSKSFVAQLFLRFQAIFGHRWVSLIPDADTQTIAINEWRQRLKGITEAEVEAGVERLNNRPADKRDWPPGAAEFRALCRPHREPYERADFQGCALSRDRQIEQQPASREYGLDQIAALRGRMGAGHG